MVCARMHEKSVCAASSFKDLPLSYEDGNTVVASGVAGIVCSAKSMDFRADFKEEAEKRLCRVVQRCLQV